METALMPLSSKILWSSSRVGLVTRENVGVNLHQCCGSCSIIPILDFETAASECTIRRMKKEQARPCMCGRTKQTMRFLHETPNKTPHSTITFLPHRDKGKRTQTAHASHATLYTGCLSTKRLNTKLRVLSSGRRNLTDRDWTGFSTTRHAREGLPSRPPNKGQSAICSKTLECPTAVENKDNETKGENLTALPATCKNLRHRRKKKKSHCAGQHINRRT